MNIEAKPKTVVTLVLVIAVILAAYFYLQKTKPMRTYKTEVKRLRIIEEHQRLEIEVTKQKATLDAMKKAAEDAMPTYTLTPEQKEEKKKVMEANP